VPENIFSRTTPPPSGDVDAPNAPEDAEADAEAASRRRAPAARAEHPARVVVVDADAEGDDERDATLTLCVVVRATVAMRAHRGAMRPASAMAMACLDAGVRARNDARRRRRRATTGDARAQG
jgi:hypothetical protein